MVAVLEPEQPFGFLVGCLGSFHDDGVGDEVGDGCPVRRSIRTIRSTARSFSLTSLGYFGCSFVDRVLAHLSSFGDTG